MSKFYTLEKAVNDLDLRYLKVDFPITHTKDGNFQSTNGAEFRFSLDGAGYLSERNTNYRYAQFTALVRNGLWEDLARLANEAILPIKGGGQGLIFAVVDGYVVGTLRHYHPIAHKNLLRALQENGLAEQVVAWDLTSQHVVIKVGLRKVLVEDDKERLVLGLRIVNGHSGHHALHYELWLQATGYEFSLPLRAHSRHLKNVDIVLDEIEHVLKEISEIRLDLRLLELSGPTTLQLIREKTPVRTIRQESLLTLVEGSVCESGLDVLALLGQYANTRGFVTAVGGLLDPLIEYLLTI